MGLGFAAFEDMKYAVGSLTAPPPGVSPLGSVFTVTFGRDLSGPFEHPVMTSLLAAALFAATVNGRWRITLRVVAVYLGVAAAHGLIDSLPGLLELTGNGALLDQWLALLLALLIIVGLGVIWLAYSRRLKRADVAAESEAILPSAEVPVG